MKGDTESGLRTTAKTLRAPNLVPFSGMVSVMHRYWRLSGVIVSQALPLSRKVTVNDHMS